MYGQFKPPGGAGPYGTMSGGPNPPSYSTGYQPSGTAGMGGYGGQPSFPSAGPPSGSNAHADDKLAKVKDPLLMVIRWFKDRSPQEKTGLGVIGGIVLLLVLWRCAGLVPVGCCEGACCRALTDKQARAVVHSVRGRQPGSREIATATAGRSSSTHCGTLLQAYSSYPGCAPRAPHNATHAHALDHSHMRAPTSAERLSCTARARLLLRVSCRTVEDHDTLFVLAEIAHFVGIGLLGFKMYSKRSAAGAHLAGPGVWGFAGVCARRWRRQHGQGGAQAEGLLMHPVHSCSSRAGRQRAY